MENELHDAHVLNYEQFWQDGHVLIYRMQVARAAQLQDMLTKYSSHEYRDAVANCETAFRRHKVAEEELSECERTRAKAPETGDIEKVRAARAAVADAAQTLRSAEVNIQSLRGDFYGNLQPDEIAVAYTAPEQTEQAAPEVVEATRLHLLATRAELCTAFGVWGLNFAMFDNLNDRQWLKNARKVMGHGQRGHVIEPLFCPLEVMQGLATRVKKPKITEAKGWDILEHKFNAVFEENQQFDPRERTG